MSDTDLYCRQRVLREIGSEGQARLRAATFAPSAHLSARARRVAELYARASGWGGIAATRSAAPQALASTFRHQAAADVALGALDVLNASLPLFDIPPKGSEK